MTKKCGSSRARGAFAWRSFVSVEEGGNAGDSRLEKEKAQFRPVLFKMVTYCGNRYELCV